MQFALTAASAGGLTKYMISGMAKPFRPTKMGLTIRFAPLLYEF